MNTQSTDTLASSLALLPELDETLSLGEFNRVVRLRDDAIAQFSRNSQRDLEQHRKALRAIDEKLDVYERGLDVLFTKLEKGKINRETYRRHANALRRKFDEDCALVHSA